MNTHMSGGNEIVVSARVPSSLRDLIDEVAADLGQDRSQFIRNALQMVITAAGGRRTHD
jgi:metal-responsive CopG/Arc/MetJ family transcriptional regulator